MPCPVTSRSIRRRCSDDQRDAVSSHTSTRNPRATSSVLSSGWSPAAVSATRSCWRCSRPWTLRACRVRATVRPDARRAGVAALTGSSFCSIAISRGSVHRNRSVLSALPSASMSSTLNSSSSPSRSAASTHSPVSATVTRSSSPATRHRTRVAREALPSPSRSIRTPSQLDCRSRSGSGTRRSTTRPSLRCKAGWSPAIAQRSWNSGGRFSACGGFAPGSGRSWYGSCDSGRS